MGICDNSSHLDKSRFIIRWPVRCRLNSPNERVVDQNSQWPSVYSHLNSRKCEVWQSHSVASIDCGLQVYIPQVWGNFWKISNSLQRNMVWHFGKGLAITTNASESLILNWLLCTVRYYYVQLDRDCLLNLFRMFIRRTRSSQQRMRYSKQQRGRELTLHSTVSCQTWSQFMKALTGHYLRNS